MTRKKPPEPAGTDIDKEKEQSLDAVPWTSLGPEIDGGQQGLTPLLLHRLEQTVGNSRVTIAQLLVNRLITFALDGHFGSLEEILIRIDGDTKSSEPAAKLAKNSIMTGDFATSGLLDAWYDAFKDSPSV